jgi:phage-related protein
MTGESPDWTIEYYTDARGKSDVREYIDSLRETEQAQTARHLQLLEEFGLELQMPHARALKGHKPLHELRPGGNRVIYFAHAGRRFIMLYAFRKKGTKTPRKCIEIAERRMYEVLERENDS